MSDDWTKKVIKEWKDIAPELGVYLEYVHESIEELEKRIETLEKHAGIHLPF